MNGGAQPVCPVSFGNASKLPKCALKSFAQALKAFRKADYACFPVRERKHKMVEQMIEKLSLDCNLQLSHPCKVRLTQHSGIINLGEEHLFLRTLQRTPCFNPPLQRSNLSIRKSPRIAPLQILEKSLRLEAGINLKLCLNLFPNILKGIRPGPPRVLHLGLAWKHAAIPPFSCRLFV